MSTPGNKVSPLEVATGPGSDFSLPGFVTSPGSSVSLTMSSGPSSGPMASLTNPVVTGAGAGAGAGMGVAQEGTPSKIELFIAEVVASDYYSGFFGRRGDSLLLVQLQETLGRITSGESLDRTIAYLRGRLPPDGSLFVIAADVMARLNKICYLNDETLSFLHELRSSNNAVYENFLDYLSVLCTRQSLFLTADHIDTVVASLKKQQQLPANSLDTLNELLVLHPIDMEAIIRDIRREQGPSLMKMARNAFLMHHDFPHAAEVVTRSMYIIQNKLALLTAASPTDHFLKAVVRLMIEFHDFIQTPEGKAGFKSVELATGAKIIEWLNEKLPRELSEPLRPLLEFIANQIIVLGTTMVFSPKQTVDLWEIFLQMIAMMQREGMVTGHVSNTQLIDQIKKMLLVVSVCDKNPTSVRVLAQMQRTDHETATLPLVKTYFPGTTLLLEYFFSSIAFSGYYDLATPSDDDSQAFLMALVAHLSMRAEISYNEKVGGKRVHAGTVALYIDFVKKIREQFSLIDEDVIHRRCRERVALERKMGFFKSMFQAHKMQDIVETLLFNAIEKEKSFCLSQVGGLKASGEILNRGVTPYLIAVGKPAVDAMPEVVSAPVKDAYNLLSLQDFYNELASTSDKEQLVSELLLAVVFQAGYLYAKKDGTHYDLCTRRSRRASLSELTKNSMFQSRKRAISGDDSILGQGNMARLARLEDSFIPDAIATPYSSFTP